MSIQVVYDQLQQWAIDADAAGFHDLSISLWSAVEAAGDVLHVDDEDEEE